MPERVKTGCTCGTWDTKSVQNRIQHVLPKHVRIKWETIFLAEDEVVGLLLFRSLAMPFQCRNKYSTKVNRPNAALSLRSYQLPAPKTLLYLHLLFREINMFPLQAENFPCPDAGKSKHLEDRAITFRRIFQDLLHLFRRPNRFLDTFHSRLVAVANRRFLD